MAVAPCCNRTNGLIIRWSDGIRSGRNEDLWGVRIHYQVTTALPETASPYLSDHQHKQFTVKISCRELAALEMLYHVPRRQGFDEAMLLMENLATLRPQVVQALLRDCRSVKVTRLFLYMAERPSIGPRMDTKRSSRGDVYGEMIDYRGKAITVPSGPEIAIVETPDDYAVSFYSGERCACQATMRPLRSTRILCACSLQRWHLRQGAPVKCQRDHRGHLPVLLHYRYLFGLYEAVPSALDRHTQRLFWA